MSAGMLAVIWTGRMLAFAALAIVFGFAGSILAMSLVANAHANDLPQKVCTGLGLLLAWYVAGIPMRRAKKAAVVYVPSLQVALR